MAVVGGNRETYIERQLMRGLQFTPKNSGSKKQGEIEAMQKSRIAYVKAGS